MKRGKLQMNRVVVIDDEYIVVQGIKAMIAREKMNFEVVGSGLNGVEGLQVIMEQKPDLVITDIRMPGMDGLSLIEAAKIYIPGGVFVVISGYQEFEYARKALELGVKGYIDKPITIEKIKETLSMAEKEISKAKAASESGLEENFRIECQDKCGLLLEKLRGGESDEGMEVLEQILSLMKNFTKGLDEYKNECYRIVCMAMEIYREERSNVEKEIHMPSYNNMESIVKHEETDEYMKELFCRMFEKIKVTKLGSMHRTVSQLLEHIHENYNKDIGLSELADMVNMNPAYLSILFKDEVGMSYIKYLTKIRMDKAKKFLIDGYKVNEVSEMVGYSNYRYFCDIFKKNEGQTPNEYKGNVRKIKEI